jgi:serine carboxypeptidase-like clade 4
LPFFVTGESYAGHYIPAISSRIIQANQNKEGLPINIQGSAIGNGWVDPYIQYGAYAEFAYDFYITFCDKLDTKTI